MNISNIQDAQQILRCAKKLVQHATATDNKNFKVSTNKRAVLQALTVALLPTPTKQSDSQISLSFQGEHCLDLLDCQSVQDTILQPRQGRSVMQLPIVTMMDGLW